MAALASDLEGDIVGGVALHLEGAGREVVEVLVEELEAHSQSSVFCAIVGQALEKCRFAASHCARKFLGVASIAHTSFAALAISWKAGTDMVAIVVGYRRYVEVFVVGDAWEEDEHNR